MILGRTSALLSVRVTIKRYLDGQVPSLEYSNIMKKALLSPDYFYKKLEENKNKITPASYKKSQKQ